jgi:hypothetical protein
LVYIINYFIFVLCLINKLITMETNDKVLTPEESLQLITKTIASIKENYKKDNYYFILWGWMVTLASVSQFAMLRILISMKSYENLNLYSFLIWGIIIAVGVFLQYYHRLRKESLDATGHMGKFFKILWQSSGIAIILAVLISIKLHVFPNPFVLTIAGLATLVSGRLINFKPLIFGGISFFVFAIAASFYNNEYQLLIGAAAIIAGYIIPGYMLKHSKE